LDIIKDGWLKANMNDPKVMSKYRVRKIPILNFEDTIYEPNKERVNKIMNDISNPSPKKREREEPIWTEHMSKTHNKPYWYNRVTKKSVWTKPDELKGGKKRKRTMKKRRRNKNMKKSRKN